jgi:hypothetical protein
MPSRCEDCGAKTASYGTPTERKRRWCAGCGKSHGAVKRFMKLEKRLARNLKARNKRAAAKRQKQQAAQARSAAAGYRATVELAVKQEAGTPVDAEKLLPILKHRQLCLLEMQRLVKQEEEEEGGTSAAPIMTSDPARAATAASSRAAAPSVAPCRVPPTPRQAATLRAPALAELLARSDVAIKREAGEAIDAETLPRLQHMHSMRVHAVQIEQQRAAPRAAPTAAMTAASRNHRRKAPPSQWLR